MSSKLDAICIISFMLTISQLPRLSGSLKSDLVTRRMPSTQSSMYVKLRVCLPSPHISISDLLVSTCGRVKQQAGSRCGAGVVRHRAGCCLL